MATSNDKDSYTDCFRLFEQALGSGIRVHCISEGAARNLRTRLHSARALDRKGGRYDGLVCQVKQENKMWWVYIHQSTLRIEPLEGENVRLK